MSATACRRIPTREELAKEFGGSRHGVDMLASAARGLDPGLRDEVLALLDAGQLPITVAGYVARFPLEEQREALELFQQRGARYAKRLVECQNTPPSVSNVAERTRRWLANEFPWPVVDAADVAAALRLVAADLSAAAVAAEPAP